MMIRLRNTIPIDFTVTQFTGTSNDKANKFSVTVLASSDQIHAAEEDNGQI
jgi:hypothetical protein